MSLLEIPPVGFAMSDDQVDYETRRRGEDLAMARCPPFSQRGTGLGDKQPLHSYLVLWAI